MTPRRSVLGWFTARGRLRNSWAKALTESDPARLVERLRAVVARFSANPARSAALWPPFLTSVLDGPAARHFPEDDLRSLENVGAQIARQAPGTVNLAQVWLPIVTVRDARGERPAACALLARLYRAEGATPETKANVARELAKRRAAGDDHLAIYIDHLRRAVRPVPEPDILGLLTEGLATGFDVDKIRIKRARELAGHLREARIAIRGTDLALGFYHLVIDANYALARTYLEAAWAAEPANEMALTGLLSAYLRADDRAGMAAVAAKLGRPAPPRVQGLIELARVLDWLEDASLGGAPPVDTVTLAAWDLAAVAGEWLDYALGRLHLLEGDAQRAADLLRPLAEANPRRPRLAYHAAWAAVLTDDRVAVARRFATTVGWSRRWTIACLFVDVDPARAARAGARLEPDQVPTPYAPIVAARAQLAAGLSSAHLPVDLPLPAGGTLEEDMEALRTVLGVWYAQRDHVRLTQLLTVATFHRLPRAEQLLWSGLCASLVAPADGRALLERAAHEMGYLRAVLVLAVDRLEQQRPEEADRLLAAFAWRTDRKLELLRAWIAAVGTRKESGVVRLEQLAERGEPRAHYALGNLHLERAVDAHTAGQPEQARFLGEQAAAEFHTALDAGAAAVPYDAEALASCAELISGATDAGPAVIKECARHWPAVRTWPAGPRGRWASWGVAGSDLVHHGAAVDLDAAEFLVGAAGSAGAAAPTVVGALATALTQVCLSDPGSDRAQDLAELLGRLTGRGLPEVDRMHGLVIAAAARHTYAGLRESALAQADELARGRPENVAIALVAAEVTLDHAGGVSAARYLHDATPSDSLEREVLLSMADLLEGRAQPAQPPDHVAPPFALALRIAYAAAMADTDAARCLDALVHAMPAGDLASIVDLRGVLPSWCAQAARARRVPAPLVELVRRLGQADADGMDPLVLARCATVVGEAELAARLWRQALSGQTERPVREEYVRFWCHQAVRARRRGEHPQAVEYLRSAAALAEDQ
jgi:hypothetical protein